MQGTHDLVDADVEKGNEEQSLVELAVKRDRNAFAQLYDLHMNSIYKHIYYRVGNQSDAEDLSADVFLKAWQAIDRYRQQGVPFRAWLLRIANNLVIDRYRTAKERVTLDELMADSSLENDPVAAAEMKLAKDELRSAILRLKREHQQVIILRFVDGLSNAEVAAAMGKSEGSVRVIQHRALRELRGLLEGGKK